MLHAHGDSTGREIGRALYLKAKALKAIEFREFEFTTVIVMRDGEAAGCESARQEGHLHEIHASRFCLPQEDWARSIAKRRIRRSRPVTA